MADEERVVGGLRVRIDRTRCVGFGDCVTAAPAAFALGDDDIAVFVAPESIDREQLLRACRSCPVDALTVWDEHGEQIAPCHLFRPTRSSGHECPVRRIRAAHNRHGSRTQGCWYAALMPRTSCSDGFVVASY